MILYIDTSSSHLYTGIVENGKIRKEIKKEYGHELSKVVVNDIQKDCHDIISLAPKYDEDIKQYEDIITSALSELEHPKTKKKKNKNIAITGIYGWLEKGKKKKL